MMRYFKSEVESSTLFFSVDLYDNDMHYMMYRDHYSEPKPMDAPAESYEWRGILSRNNELSLWEFNERVAKWQVIQVERLLGREVRID